METNPHVEAILGDLASLVGGDPQAREVFERIGPALESTIQVRFLDAIGEAAMELSGQLPAGRVDVRLSGRDVELVYVDETGSLPVPADVEGETARITLRIPEALKVRIEEQAEAERLSVNAWLVRAIEAALERGVPGIRTGNRITGFAQS